MDNDTTIRVEHVSKKYCKTLKYSMRHGLIDVGLNLIGRSSQSDRLRRDEFWAVDDISFELRKGEALGLIGPNGSGKSTLLKMLNGIFWPDKGRVTVKGRIGALIEVGAGFHPLLSGRENVYLNGAILGMTKQEINAKFDDILKFADIGDFIDAPVKTYSSGMYVRLGFAVAAHCEPDILLVDEVLAVGDTNFQNRCLRFINEIMEKCAVVIVSHNPNIIRFNCNKVLFLNKGKNQFMGSSSEGINVYDNYMLKLRMLEADSTITKSRYDSGIKVGSLALFDKNFFEISEITAGETAVIEGTLILTKTVRQVIIGFSFRLDSAEESFCCYSSQVNGGQFYDLLEGEHRFRITIPELSLKAGLYNLGMIISEKKETAHHTLDFSKFIQVNNPHPEFGLYCMQVQFEMDKERNKKPNNDTESGK